MKNEMNTKTLVSGPQDPFQRELLRVTYWAQQKGMDLNDIVDKMNLVMPNLDKAITIRRLNGWLGIGKEFRPMPAAYLPAFCLAVGNDQPMNSLANEVGLNLLNPKQFAEHEIMKLIDEISALQELVSEKAVAFEREYGIPLLNNGAID